MSNISYNLAKFSNIFLFILSVVIMEMDVIMNDFFIHSCMYLNMFICDGNLTFKSIHKNNYEEQLETI